MSLESVLKQLESRIEEFSRAHGQARARAAELEGRVTELEAELASRQEELERLQSLDGQRDELASRLAGLLETIDQALTAANDDEG